MQHFNDLSSLNQTYNGWFFATYAIANTESYVCNSLPSVTESFSQHSASTYYMNTSFHSQQPDFGFNTDMQKDDLQFTENYEQQNKESEKKKCFKQYYAKHVDKKKQQAKNSYMKNEEKRKEYFKRQYLKRKADSETFHKIKQHVKNSYEKSKETKKEYFKQQYLKQKTCGKLKTKQKTLLTSKMIQKMYNWIQLRHTA